MGLFCMQNLVIIRAYGASDWFISKVEGDLDASEVVCLHGVGEMGGLPSGLPVCRHTVGRLKLAMLLRHKVVALPWQTGVCLCTA